MAMSALDVDVSERSRFRLISSDEDRERHVVRSDEAASGEEYRPLPEQLLKRYVLLAARRADTTQLDDGTWYAEVGILRGVWAEGESEDEALRDLERVVDGWVRLKFDEQHGDIPRIGDIDLNRV